MRVGPLGTVYRVRVRYNQRGGGRTVSRSFTTLAAALAWRAEALAAIRDGGEPPAPPAPRPDAGAAATVQDAARNLCRGMVAGTVRARTGSPFKPSVVRKYESMLRLYVIPAIGGLPVRAMVRRDVQRLVDDLAARESAETARKALTALRVALRVAERDGLMDGNPCSGVRVPIDPEGERAARVLTPEECDAIVSAAEADDRRLRRSLGGPLFALAFGTGLRSGELLALVWGKDGLDLEAGVVHVRRSLDRDRSPDGSFAVVTPKSRASIRDVPLPPQEIAHLARHRAACGNAPDGSLVFADARQRPLYAKGTVRYAWRSALKGAGITPPLPRFHDARHAWAVAALRAGVRPEAVATLGGWSDVGMVHRRYGRHALPDELLTAGAAIQEYRTRRRAAALRVASDA